MLIGPTRRRSRAADQCGGLLDGDTRSPGRRERALAALVHYYMAHAQRHAEEAGRALLRHDTPAPRCSPDARPGGSPRALQWFTANRLNLLDILGLLDHEPRQENIRQALVSLVAALPGYLRNSGPWDTAKNWHERAARRSTGLAKAIVSRAERTAKRTRRSPSRQDPQVRDQA
jgi:hypothetical protein